MVEGKTGFSYKLERSSAKVGTEEEAKIPGLAAGWKVFSEGRNEHSKITRFRCGLEGLQGSRNVLEGNRVQLRTGRVINENRNGVREETGFGS